MFEKSSRNGMTAQAVIRAFFCGLCVCKAIQTTVKLRP